MNPRRVLAVVGVVAAVAGMAAVYVPGLGTGLSSTYTIVTLVGLFALVQGLSAAADRFRGERRQARTPSVERRLAMPPPGDDVDERLRGLEHLQRGEAMSERMELRDRIEDVAVDVLTRQGLSPDSARAHLTAGTWTDDPRAAAFFAPDEGVPIGVRVADSVASEAAFLRRARHAVAAIAAIHRGEATPPATPDAPDVDAAGDVLATAAGIDGTTGVAGDGGERDA